MFSTIYQSLREDLAIAKRKEVYNRIRNTPRYKAQRATDDDFRVLYQSITKRGIAGETLYQYALAMPESEVGRSLIRQKFVRVLGNEDLALTALGEDVSRALQIALRGTDGDLNRPPKNEVMVVSDGPSGLQLAVRDIRERWARRPRITKFTIRSLRYRWRLWLMGTRPEIPMIDWSTIPTNPWTDADRQEQREAWHRSGLLAFWLCPEGIDAGIAAHDKLIATCEAHGIVSGPAKDKMISEITGVKPSKPKAVKNPAVVNETTLFYSPKSSTTTAYTAIYHSSEIDAKQYNKIKQKEITPYKIDDRSYNEYLHMKYRSEKSRYGTVVRNRETPCGHDAGAYVVRSQDRYYRHLAKCNVCGATWVPASRNILEIAADAPNSLRFTLG